MDVLNIIALVVGTVSLWIAIAQVLQNRKDISLLRDDAAAILRVLNMSGEEGVTVKARFDERGQREGLNIILSTIDVEEVAVDEEVIATVRKEGPKSDSGDPSKGE